MKFLTEEQEEIISICKNENNINKILISANAGSGKTFTAKEVLNAFFLEYDFSEKEQPKALYLIFNKAMSDFFKRSASHYKLDNYPFAGNLGEVVETRTYHSFLKKGENFDNALSMIFLPQASELIINYTKSDLSKQDCNLIAREFTNSMYQNNVLIDLENDEKTLKQMRIYAEKITEHIYRLFKLYFTSATSIEDKFSCDKLVKDNDFDIVKILPYENKNRFINFMKAKKINENISSYIIRELNYILDRLIERQKIEVSHSYYYKRIYENALAYPHILEEMFKPYKMIIIDECQDTDAMMFNLVKNYMDLVSISGDKKTKLVCFGDNKQNIYKFSGSFNIFDWQKENKNYFYNLTLSQSFRYGQKIADFGKLISKSTNTSFSMFGSKLIQDTIYDKALNIDEIAKLLIERYKDCSKFATKGDKNKFAIICRTNNKCIELFQELQKAIQEQVLNTRTRGFNEEYIFLDPEIKGSLKGLANKKLISLLNYSFLQDGLQTYIANNKINIKHTEMTIVQAIAEEKMHPFLKSNNLEYLLKFDINFLEKLINKRTKNNAFILITNCHQSKGKEYNSVLLADDFLKRQDDYYFTEEEVNISHTAITRAKSEIFFLDGDDNFLHYFYKNNISPELETKIDRSFFQQIRENRKIELDKLKEIQLEEERKKNEELEFKRNNNFINLL